MYSYDLVVHLSIVHYHRNAGLLFYAAVVLALKSSSCLNINCTNISCSVSNSNAAPCFWCHYSSGSYLYCKEVSRPTLFVLRTRSAPTGCTIHFLLNTFYFVNPTSIKFTRHPPPPRESGRRFGQDLAVRSRRFVGHPWDRPQGHQASQEPAEHVGWRSRRRPCGEKVAGHGW